MEEYNKIFDQLWQHAESEVVEFKKAESNFDCIALKNIE